MPDGSLCAPDGVVYRRTPRRVTPAIGRELVEGGAPVVTEVYPEEVRYFEGAAASEKWALIRPDLVTRRRPAVRDIQWVGHVWESDSGKVLVRFAGQH